MWVRVPPGLPYTYIRPHAKMPIPKIKLAHQKFCQPTDKFILAVSGGPDSQCLLKAFPHVVGQSFCLAVGVNHGLRPEADSELDLTSALAEIVGVPFRRVKLNLEPGSNIQCRARDARYAALTQAADEFGARFIVTAHHFDDRAETVLFRLLRGEGVGSLGVMPPVSGRIFRPMLSVKREKIMGYMKRWGIPYATDPSNVDKKYLRSRIRHEILPMLESINPQIKSRLNALSDEILES